MTSSKTQKLLLYVSIFFIAFGLSLTIAGVFSPAWQVVYLQEMHVEHQHGLWWICIRADKHVVSVNDFYNESPLHCMQKFDESAEDVIENSINDAIEDGAALEATLHRFWGWQKDVMFCIILSQILAILSICAGVCSPCFHPSACIYTIALFFAFLLSVIADGIFFLAANRVDNRFAQGVVGHYEQRIGYAFFLHIAGTACWLIAFICAMATSYSFYSTNRAGNDYRRPNLSHVKMEWAPAAGNNDHGILYTTNLESYPLGSNTQV